tara:strand:+ start:4280 stop:5098 length:819 start_codon:yes stop_codon:yes gene_type:complete
MVFAAADGLAAESEWRFDAWDGRDFGVRMYVPDNAGPDTNIVIVMHGASRDAPRYFRDWKALGEKLGFIVVVPEFTREQFNGSARYNLGFVFEPKTGRQRAEPEWTFSAIEPLFDAVVARTPSKQEHYTIYGHSAGAQFVHRFLYYKSETRASRYIAANAGWYTLPLNEFEYPYGLLNAGVDDTQLARIFASQLILLLGEKDTDVAGRSLRRTPEAQQQGPHRLARGMTMFRTAKARAEDLGLEFNWQIIFVKDAHHSNALMAPTAAAIAAE